MPGFFTRRKGATATEYSVLIGLLGVVVIAVLLLFGGDLGRLFSISNTTLSDATETAQGANPGAGGGGQGGGDSVLPPPPPPPPPEPEPLIIQVNATAPITLTLGFGVDATIDWGGPASSCPTSLTAGTILPSPADLSDMLNTPPQTTVSCTYDAPGVYDIEILGTVQGLHGISGAQGMGVLQWGDTDLRSLYYAFSNTPNLVTVPGTIPETVQRTDGTFSGSTPVPAAVTGWNMGNVVRTDGMFGANAAFNLDISGWDMSSVLHASSMFANATSFNQPIGAWDMTRAEYLNYMFINATSFNQPIDGWGMTNLRLTSNMFQGATSFNQSLNSWDMDRVISIRSMFQNATSFNGNVTSWNLAELEDANSAFRGATAFRQDVSGWRVPNMGSDIYGNMQHMFRSIPGLSVDLRCWNVAHIPSAPSGFSSSSPGVIQPLWNTTPAGTCPP